MISPFVIPQNVLFAFGKMHVYAESHLFFYLTRKPNEIPDKIAFLQEKAKKRFFRNDGNFKRRLR
jgi:hypothetical protein